MLLCLIFITLFILFIYIIIRKYNNYVFFTNLSNTKKIYVEATWGLCNRLRTFRTLYGFCLDNRIDLYIIDTDDSEDAFPISYKKVLPGVPLNIIAKNDIPKNIQNIINTKPNKSCTIEYKYLDTNNKDIIYLKCCEFSHDKYKSDNRFYKLIEDNIILPKNILDIKNKIIKENAIGIHIRQGSVFDYYKNNFFGYKHNLKDKEPYFCCYEDKSKNLSYCPDNIKPLEKYIKKINELPKETYFYATSDRTGCLLSLKQILKEKLILNHIYLHEKHINIIKDFYDWYCLQFCSKIITSSHSSYSHECTILNNIKKIYL